MPRTKKTTVAEPVKTKRYKSPARSQDEILNALYDKQYRLSKGLSAVNRKIDEMESRIDKQAAMRARKEEIKAQFGGVDLSEAEKELKLKLKLLKEAKGE